MSDATPSRTVLAGFVRDLPFECDGRLARGARHFAPGARVFLTQPYGSGYRLQRSTMTVTGPHRDTGELVSRLCPSGRIRGHHRAGVSGGDLLDAFARHEARARSAATPAAWRVRRFPATCLPAHQDGVGWGWEEGAWASLTATLLAPSRPRLAEALACALACTEADALVAMAAGRAGALLHDHLRTGAEARRPLGRVAEVWEALAPLRWIGAVERGFHRRGMRPEGKASPSSLMATVCLCADIAGVEAAEALARELAAACGLRGEVRVTWEVVARSAVVTTGVPPWWGRPDARFAWPTLDVPAGAWMERLPSAVWYNFAGWRSRAKDVVPPAAMAPLVAIHRLGYAVGGHRGRARGAALPRAPRRAVAGRRRRASRPRTTVPSSSKALRAHGLEARLALLGVNAIRSPSPDAPLHGPPHQDLDRGVPRHGGRLLRTPHPLGGRGLLRRGDGGRDARSQHDLRQRRRFALRGARSFEVPRDDL